MAETGGRGGAAEEEVLPGTGTFVVSAAQLEAGYTKELAVNGKLVFTIDSSEHSLVLSALTATTATVTIASAPQQLTLSIGEEARLELNDDDYYDLYVKLNRISSDKASITIKKIHEAISAAKPQEENVTKEIQKVEEKKEEAPRAALSKSVIYAIAGFILLGVIVMIIYLARASKKRK